MMKTIKILFAALTLAWCANIGLTAQTAAAQFSVLSLNVDGLPGKIYFFNVNADGPQEMGSERISQYLAGKDCDILCLQENFNYQWMIRMWLLHNYDVDEWTGAVDPEKRSIDFAHLQNLKFECDGLNMFWKKSLTTTDYDRVAWNRSFGKFSHDFDDMITKGFRRHDVTLPDGHEVVVYNMHMDASSTRDEQKHNDAKDREARLSQWVQLRDYILNRLDSRPVIIAGDMNSLYHRDEVKSQFIDAINATGKATCGDVWVEKVQGGVYPQTGSEPTADETLDKILYVNPAGGQQIVPVAYTIEKEAYTYEGKPLGDHYPIMVTFQFTTPATGITAVSTERLAATTYDLKGLKLDKQQHCVQIVDGKKVLSRTTKQ